MLGSIGLLLGLGFFVCAAYKRMNIILASLATCVIMALFSGLPLYETLSGAYMSGLSGFLKSYFLMILFSAIFGRLMNDSGGAKRIASTVLQLVSHSSPQRKKFMSVLLVAILYYAFSYIGISGFVLVFTVMPIAKHLFQETDTPWRLFCFGGPQIAASTALAGSLNQGNIFAADVCGTNTTAGALLSIIVASCWWAVTLLLIRYFLADAEKHHETFLTDGAAIAAASSSGEQPQEKLPSLAASLAPMALIMLSTAVLHIDITRSLILGCFATVVILFPFLKENLFSTLTKGSTECYASVLTVSALYGFGNVVKQLPAFAAFSAVLGALPALLQGPILGSIASFVIAGSPIPIFGEQILNSYLAAGLSPELAHRMMTTMGWTALAPHNAGLSNSSLTTKIDYSRALKVYMLAAYIPGLACSLLSLLLVGLHIIH